MAKKVAVKKKTKERLVAKAASKPAKRRADRKRSGGVDEELNIFAITVEAIDPATGMGVVIVGADFRKDLTLRISGNCSPDNGTTVTVSVTGAVPNPVSDTSAAGQWSVDFPNVTGVANNVTARAGAKNAILHGTNEAVLFRTLAAAP